MKHSRATAFTLIIAAASISVAAQEDASTPAPAADPAKAQSTATTLCAACHGADGNSPLPVNPNLAGQHPEYLFKQLADYKAGRRKNAVMNGIAASLSDADMRNLAAYFAQQPAKPAAAKNRELALRGQQVYRAGQSAAGVPSCMACHSPDGSGIPVQYPRLAGQHSEYTLAQLQLFRTGERGNDANSVMGSIAALMSDKEMAAVAEYIAGLK